MRRVVWLASLLACCAMIAVGLSQAQVAQTGAGKGAPGGGVAAYTGPGDQTGWTTGALVFWGLRGFNFAFSGPVANVCDAATGTAHCADATWSSAGGGVLTLPLIGGSPCDNSTNQCEIAILYDQVNTNCGGSGNCNLTAAPGSRPLLVVNCLGTHPCISPGGNFMSSSGGLAVTQNQPFSQTVVGSRTSGTGFSAMSDANAGSVESLFGNGSGVISIYDGSIAFNVTGVTENVVHTFAFVFDGSTSSSAKIQVDSGSVVTGNLGATATITTAFSFHFPSSSNGSLTGHLFESGWWSGDTSLHAIDMHNNQCSYWGTTC